MSSLRRGTGGIWFLIKNGQRIRHSCSRSMSTVQNIASIENGKNGQKIFKSPFGADCVYPNVPLHEYVWRNFRDWENQIALKCGVTDRQYTYAEARDASNWIARSLLNMGFKNGDVIALVLPNLPETILAFLGSIEAGLTVTTVNPIYTADEISRQLIDSGAKGVIVNGEISSTVMRAVENSLPSKSPFIVIDDGTGSSMPPGSIPFKDLVKRGKSLPPLPQNTWNPDDVAVIPYSSGTTGLSKGVLLSHKNLISNMIQVNNSIERTMWIPASENYQEIVPSVLPFFHIYGMNAVMLPTLAIGAQLITIPKFIPKTYVDVLTRNKVTGLFLVPPLVLFMTSDPTLSKNHVDSVRYMTSGAAPIAASDINRFYDKFQIDDTKIEFSHGYGLTECSPVAFMNQSCKKYASIGVPVCDSEARIVDPETSSDIMTPGKTGELWVRGSHVMKGYHKNEAATNETVDAEGWLKTGDLAYFDEDFDFFITDRLKELIKVKGFQVPPAELEALLRTHPDIAEAAVIGIPDERAGELPRAFILPKKDRNLTEKDVQNFVEGKVAEYKELRGGVTFVDNIPKNSTGKILRRVFKDQYSK